MVLVRSFDIGGAVIARVIVIKHGRLLRWILRTLARSNPSLVVVVRAPLCLFYWPLFLLRLTTPVHFTMVLAPLISQVDNLVDSHEQCSVWLRHCL